MGHVQLVVALLGLLAGLAIIPVYEGVHRWFVRTWNPAGSFHRVVVVMLVVTIVACFAAGLLIIGPGYLLGLIPLRENTLYFVWAFAAGGIVMRGFVEWRKRHTRASL